MKNFTPFAAMMALACALTLSACGGGGGGGEANPTPSIKGPSIPRQVTAAGDSTMAGLIKNPDGTYTVTGAPTADLQADLQAKFGPIITVVPRGVVGSTLPDLIAGTGTSQNFVQSLTTDTSQIVLENMGINDGAVESNQAFQAALEQFVDDVRQAGKVPILEEPNPLCDPNAPPSQNVEAVYASGQTIGALVAIINQVAQAKNVPVIHQYSLIKALPNWCSLMSDGWGHPSLDLYAIKAQNEAAVLAPIVSAQ